MELLENLEKKQDYLGLIKELKSLIAEDRRVFTDPFVKSWCGKRWRNLFIQEAIKHEDAVLAATKKKLIGKDDRPDKQKIAERFLRGDNLDDWKIDMPEAQHGDISNTTLLFCPGLLNGLLPVRAFTAEFPAIVEKPDGKFFEPTTIQCRDAMQMLTIF